MALVLLAGLTILTTVRENMVRGVVRERRV
jgi:hypothetical protein